MYRHGARMHPHDRMRYRTRGFGLACALTLLVGCSDGEPPPGQPIAFSHRTHSDEGISCDRCHQGAETQAEAGLPPLSSCAVCHRRRAIPDHPEVVKFMTNLDAGEPVLWRKVHVIPQSAMVHFKHNAHMRAGIDCSTCHGDVAGMTVARQVVDVANMGWCLSCHRENDASVDCLTCHH